jgi:hypothetical protein
MIRPTPSELTARSSPRDLVEIVRGASDNETDSWVPPSHKGFAAARRARAGEFDTPWSGTFPRTYSPVR